MLISWRVFQITALKTYLNHKPHTVYFPIGCLLDDFLKMIQLDDSYIANHPSIHPSFHPLYLMEVSLYQIASPVDVQEPTSYH